MLRLVWSGNAMPGSFILDPSAEFMPGQCAQQTVINNQVMMTVSDGTAPFGIIDDIRTRAFTSVSWDEVIIVPATGVVSGNQLVTPIDIKAELKHAYIDKRSFMSTVEVQLIPVNGVIVFPAGTPLNCDQLGTGEVNAIRTIVNYTYQVPNIPGDDSTIGSGRVTVWFERMIFETDQYETNQAYPINSNLYISEKGLWTTRRPSKTHPVVGMVCGAPNSLDSNLQIMWY